jgi:hypothetical protein
MPNKNRSEFSAYLCAYLCDPLRLNFNPQYAMNLRKAFQKNRIRLERRDKSRLYSKSIRQLVLDPLLPM